MTQSSVRKWAYYDAQIEWEQLKLHTSWFYRHLENEAFAFWTNNIANEEKYQNRVTLKNVLNSIGTINN